MIWSYHNLHIFPFKEGMVFYNFAPIMFLVIFPSIKDKGLRMFLVISIYLFYLVCPRIPPHTDCSLPQLLVMLLMLSCDFPVTESK